MNKWLIAGIAAMLSFSAQASVVFSDNFNDNDVSDWTASEDMVGDFTVSNGELSFNGNEYSYNSKLSKEFTLTPEQQAANELVVSFNFNSADFNSYDSLGFCLNIGSKQIKLGLSEQGKLWAYNPNTDGYHTIFENIEFNTDNKLEIFVDDIGSGTVGYSLALNDGAQTRSYNYFVENGSSSANSVVFYNNYGAYKVDNLLVAIPEPATLGLFGLAGAAVFAARRRRNNQ